MIEYGRLKGCRILGPNCPGISSSRYGKMGIMPTQIFRKGKTGVVSRSGTLTYEIVSALSEAGIGQSTCIGIGGRPNRRDTSHRCIGEVRIRSRDRECHPGRGDWGDRRRGGRHHDSEKDEQTCGGVHRGHDSTSRQTDGTCWSDNFPRCRNGIEQDQGAE